MLPFWRKKNRIRTKEPPLIIDIAGQNLLLVQTAPAPQADGRRTVLRCLQRPLPPGNDGELLLEWLKENQLDHLPATLLLAMQEYQVQVTELPQVPPEEIHDALRWRLGETFNLSDAQDVTFDHQPLPGQGFNPTPTQALVFVVDNPLLLQRQTFLLDAGLGLNVIDAREMAQRNLSALLEPDERGQAVLSLNDQGGLLTVTHRGTLYLTRRLDLSLSALILADASRRLELIERAALEVQRSLDIFDRQYSALGLSRLLVSPMPEQQEFINDLAQNLYIPVAAYDLQAALDIGPHEELKDPLFVASAWGALGASLRPAPGGAA